MDRFNLQIWLDSGRKKKVVTKDGMPIDIIFCGDYDRKLFHTEFPVLANKGGWIYQCNEFGEVEDLLSNPDRDKDYQLYFADEEEKYRFDASRYENEGFSKIECKLIEFRNSAPLCSVPFRESGNGKTLIRRFAEDILNIIREETKKQ